MDVHTALEKLNYQDKFVERTLQHIEKVNKYARKINKSYPNHDKDKLSTLLEPYSLMNKRSNTKGGLSLGTDMSGLTPEEEDALNKATLQHITQNEHHPEHWCKETLTSFDRANPPMGLDCSDMPNEAIDEMLCDWSAVGEELGNTPMQWMEKSVPSRWKFTEEQVEYMNNRLKDIWG